MICKPYQYLRTVIYDENIKLFNHKLLIDDGIGQNGENLTIMILSCNRVDATIKLLDSAKEHLKGFLGEVLIIDNNSNSEELDILKKYLSKYPFKNNIVEFKENYGVAGGRNRGIDYVGTE
jgi:GT2 family glycosyltransferase